MKIKTRPGEPSDDDAAIVETAVIEESRLWMLSTPNSSYVVGLDDKGVPRQAYWGPRLDDRALQEFTYLRRDRWVSTFERPAEADEELPVDGGHRWGPPSLQVRFAEHVRALELRFVAAEVLSDGLVISLLDDEFGLTVDLRYRLRDGSDMIERCVELGNRGDQDVSVLRVDSGRWLVPDLPDYRASYVRGFWGGEMQLSRETLPFGTLANGSRLGVTGHTSNPWITVDDGTATEHHGETWTVALAWSGSWQLSAQRRPEGSLSIATGLGHGGLEFPLRPGQTFRTPPTLGLYANGGFGGASRAWHTYVREAVQPHGDELRPVLYNSWEATHFDVHEESQRELARRARDLGVELFVVDDGWFSGRNNDATGLGDWFPDHVKFPSGLGPLAETVHAYGMRFGIWVEPEMVNAKSRLFASHPEWTYHWPNRTPTEVRNQRVLNFAREDVREHTFAWLDALVRDNGIDFLKWDMNRPITEAGWPDQPEQTDWVWIEHTRGVYGVIDRLRAAHPDLRIESCSSGGGRVDLGILARTDQVWPSDNTDALDRQVMQHGFSQLYPAGTMSSWVTDAVNLVSGRSVPLSYRFHVAMAGVLGIGADIAEWSDETMAEAAAFVSQYKEVRRTIQHGRQFRLLGEPGRGASAVQYIDDEQIVLLTYEPHRSLSDAPRWVRLEGLEPGSSYVERFLGNPSGHRVAGHRYTASYLSGHGLPFNNDLNDRGWNNLRFSNRDYLSRLTVLVRAG